MTAHQKNNPNRRPEGALIAHIGFSHSFSQFMGSYTDAVEVLYGKIATGEMTPEYFAEPLLFLMRHTLELGYKLTLEEMHFLLERKYKLPRDPHSLKGSHEMVEKLFPEIAERFSVPEDIKNDFAAHCERAKKAMNEFDRLDPKSEAFRYPTDKQGKLLRTLTDTVDLLTLKNLFDDAVLFLVTTPDVLSPARTLVEASEA